MPFADLLQEAIALGRELVAAAPLAVETTKRLLADATSRPRDLRGPAAITAQVRVSDEAREGVLAFLQRRPPVWETRAGAGRPEGAKP